MDWFKTNSDLWMHPKIVGLTDLEFRVLVTSWGYASQYETGGRIPQNILPVLGGTEDVATALEDAKLWRRNGAGWVIHDWDEHQEAALKIEERKKYDRERKRAERRGAKDA